MPFPHNEAKGMRIGGGVQVGTWRHRAVLITPRSWRVAGDYVTGLDVHRLLLDRLTRLGLRAPAASAETAPTGSS